MRLALRSTVVIALLASCNKDDAGDSGAETGSESSTSTTTGGMTMSTTTAPADTSTSAVDSSSGSESTTGVAEVRIGGVVQDLALGMPINAANIGILDMPGFDTVSDQNGGYKLDPLPPGIEVFVEIDNNANYWGSVIGLTVPNEDEDDQTLAQISHATVDEQISYLMGQGDVMVDDTKAVVVVRLLQNLAAGMCPDDCTTVAFDPPPPDMTTYYAPDVDGHPILGKNTVEFSFLPVVVYFNVDESDAGDITITATHPTRTCTVVHPAFPTLGNHVTLVDVDCPTN